MPSQPGSRDDGTTIAEENCLGRFQGPLADGLPGSPLTGTEDPSTHDFSESLHSLGESLLQGESPGGVAGGDTSRPRAAEDFDPRLVSIAARLSRVGAWYVDLPEFRLTCSSQAAAILGMPPGAYPAVVYPAVVYPTAVYPTAVYPTAVYPTAVYPTAEEAIGYSAPEFREMAVAAFGDCVRDGKPFDLELQIVTATGRRVWVRSVGEAVRDGLGSVKRVEGVVEDISERRELAAARGPGFESECRLATENNRLALAMESAHIGVWDWDVVANKLVWDRQMCRLYGIRETEFGGAYDAWRNSLHPDDMERAEAELTRALYCDPGGAGHTAWHSEFRVVWLTGEVHHMEAHAIVQRAPDGSARRMTGLNRDITARKQSERLAERALQRLSEAQRIGLIGDWDWDFATQSVTWSRQVFDIIGRDPDRGQPRDFEDAVGMYDAAGRALINEKVGRLIETGEPQEYELAGRRSDGSEFHVQARATVTRDESGGVVGIHGTLQDVTARRLGEQAIVERARQQEIIAKLGSFAMEDKPSGELYAEAASAIAKGFGTGYSRVMQFSSGDRSFTLKAGVGFGSECLDQRVSGDMRLEGILASGAAAIIVDFAADRAADFAADRAAGEGAGDCGILRAHGILSGIELAILCEDIRWGILGGYSRERRRFSAENIDFLQSVANIVANAIDRRHREARLVQLSQYDALTGLPNRTLVRDHLAIALARARETGTRVAVLYFDLDKFKNVNDAFGHSLGDQLLREVATRLAASLRASDTVSRHGGDEFLIVLPDVVSDEQVAHVAERAVRSLAEPINIGGVELLVKGSIGIACYPDHGNAAETLVRNADAAMYIAKAAGPGSYRFYSEDMNTRTHERLLLGTDLSRAVERNELFLEYQPQLAMANGAVTGVEALARWRHSTLGVVPPTRFIPVAEESGLIVAIGTWVLEAACRQQARWVTDGIARGRMAVNVSAIQLRHPAFVDTVVQALEGAGLDPCYLELELTESVVMHGIEGVPGKMASLDKLGVAFAIDDFGTGQSNLSYLKQFPIRRVKIDRSFITGLPADGPNGALTQAIISMGHALGMKVVAEGIETGEQAEYLRSLWCDDAQGFLYSRPLSAEECAALLRNERPRTGLQMQLPVREPIGEPVREKE